MQLTTRLTIIAAAAPLVLLAAASQASAIDVDVPQFPPHTSSHPPATGGSSASYCIDTIDSSHVLTRTVAGATLSGSIMESMTVYSNGLVVRCAWDGASERSHAEILVVDRSAVQDLALDLVTLGATRVCDSPLHVADVPATTVTFSDGGADAYSHSYTYQVATGDRERIADRIDQFVFQYVLGS